MSFINNPVWTKAEPVQTYQVGDQVTVSHPDADNLALVMVHMEAMRRSRDAGGPSFFAYGDNQVYVVVSVEPCSQYPQEHSDGFEYTLRAGPHQTLRLPSGILTKAPEPEEPGDPNWVADWHITEESSS